MSPFLVLAWSGITLVFGATPNRWVRSEVGSDASLEEEQLAELEERRSKPASSVHHHRKKHASHKKAAEHQLDKPAAETEQTDDAKRVKPSAAATATGAKQPDAVANSTLTATEVNDLLEKIEALQGKLSKKQVTDSKTWGKMFIWTKNVSTDGTGAIYFHCLKRFGAYVMWELPVGSPISPPNQPCTAFYVKKFQSSVKTSDTESYIDNGICTRDDWCLNGLKISSAESRTHGSMTSGRTAKEAVKFDIIAGSTRSLRVSFNTAASGFPVDGAIAPEGWQCMKQLRTPADVLLPDTGLKVTSDESLCAQVDIGWIE